MTTLLIKPQRRFDDAPTEEPDYFGILVLHGLDEPILGDEVEIGLRRSKPLRCGQDYWDGCRNPSGQPYIEGEFPGEIRHHSRKLRR
ncbi:MAG: hypothetical protein WCI47_00850 [bacterium]